MNPLAVSSPESFLEGKSHLPLKVDLKSESRPWSENCQLSARNDIEAVKEWLKEYQHKQNTYKAYRKEVLRFLMWCAYLQGKMLADLKKEDLEAYFLFLREPFFGFEDEERNKNQGMACWRPFKKALSQSALMTAVRILNSLFNYLVQAEYLRANPIKLIKQYAKLGFETEERKYQVWQRLLEKDEWAAVQKALLEMPEETAFEVDNKMRTQFLFALLYFLGLRIHEVVNLSWSSFKQRGNGQWWFFVRGKGDKPRHVAVNHQLLEFMKAYRTYLKKTAFPALDENEPLLISKRRKESLKITQLYTLIKAVGEEAAKGFAGQPQKQEKLRKFSPHWMRHLSATHQDELGFSVSMIMNNLGHASRETTQIYVHSEDDERFHAMQKLSMAVEPKIVHPKRQVLGIEYRLVLSKGPVNRGIGLSRLMAGIEQQLFKETEWVRLGDTTEALLKRVKMQGIQERIELLYQVRTQAVVEAPSIWREALKRQCEVWLFETEINMGEIVEG